MSAREKGGHMADFHQEGLITTLHALYETFDREEYLVRLEKKLEDYSRQLDINLLLPSLFSEIKNPQVLDHIVVMPAVKINDQASGDVEIV